MLLGLYYGSGFLVTRQLENQYETADCKGMLNLARTAEKIYPGKLVPIIEPALTRTDECQAYQEAMGYYEQGDWEASLRYYQSYLARYPGTPLAGHAREHAAQALLTLAKELDTKEEFEEAAEKLTILLDDFQETAPAKEAGQMLPECYLKEGMDLMEQGFYSRARTRFQNAIDTDQEPKDLSGPGARAKAMFPVLHSEWGKSLLDTGLYQTAIEHFEQAIDLTGPDELTAAEDGLSAAYVNWARADAESEDFYAALDKVSEARAKAASQDAKEEVENAAIDILKAFSNSSGEQAEALMEDFAKTVCAGKEPANVPPIFGIQPSQKPVDLSGIWFASDHLAETPGSVFYIACGEQDYEKIQSCPYVVSGGKTRYYIERRYTKWIFQLRDARTAAVVVEKEFKGGAPDTCPARETFRIGDFTKYYDGPSPSHAEVDEWLESVLPETLEPSELEPPDQPVSSCQTDDGRSEFVRFASPFTTQPVVIDGEMSSASEWSAAYCTDMLHYESGVFQDGRTLRARWWVQHDGRFIYYLARISKELPLSGVAVDYFWPRYTGTWAHSDGVFINTDGDFQDLSNWDESNWYADEELSPPGSVDTEGAVSEDDAYLWFEIKKALNSGDRYDWTLELGQVIGYNPSDSFLFALIMEDSFYTRNHQMELGKE